MFIPTLRKALRAYTLHFPIDKGKGRLVESTKAWMRTNECVVTKTSGGYRMELDLTDLIQRGIYYFGYYEKDFSLYLGRVLRTGDTFVDAGANVGQFSLLAATKVGECGKVIAIEPEDRNFAQLIRNVELNGFQNVTALNLALSDNPGHVDFYTRGAEDGFTNRGVHSLHQHADWQHPRKSRVEAATLDALLAAEKKVDVIKMDVEGAELAALKGATEILQRFESIIFLEANEICTEYFGHSTADVKKWLRDAGFLLARFNHRSLVEVSPGPEKDSMLVAFKPAHESRLRAAL